MVCVVVLVDSVDMALDLRIEAGDAVLFSVPFDVLLLELNSLGEIVRELRLLHRVPQVHYPVGRLRITAIGNASGTVGN